MCACVFVHILVCLPHRHSVWGQCKIEVRTINVEAASALTLTNRRWRGTSCSNCCRVCSNCCRVCRKDRKQGLNATLTKREPLLVCFVFELVQNVLYLKQAPKNILKIAWSLHRSWPTLFLHCKSHSTIYLGTCSYSITRSGQCVHWARLSNIVADWGVWTIYCGSLGGSICSGVTCCILHTYVVLMLYATDVLMFPDMTCVLCVLVYCVRCFIPH